MKFLERIPKGFVMREVLARMGIGNKPPENPESANANLPSSGLQTMHKTAITVIIMFFVMSIVVCVLVLKNIIFPDNLISGLGVAGLSAVFAFWYFTKAFSTHDYPDKLVIKKKGNPVWVYDEASWRGVLWPLYDWSIRIGTIIDVDLPDEDFLVPYGDKSIKLSVALFGSFELMDEDELVQRKSPVILSFKLKSDEQRWAYFRTEMIDKVSTVLGEYKSPNEIVANQGKIETKIRRLLSKECRKVGHKVKDHNMKIKSNHVGVEADSVTILGNARAEVAEKYSKAINDSWEATVFSLGHAFIEMMKDVVVARKGSSGQAAKDALDKLNKIDEKIEAGLKKLS